MGSLDDECVLLVCLFLEGVVGINTCLSDLIRFMERRHLHVIDILATITGAISDLEDDNRQRTETIVFEREIHCGDILADVNHVRLLRR